MDKKVLDWITKISKTYAQCSCGKLCHIDVTIKKDMLTYRAYCPNCNKIYTQYQSIYAFENIIMADVEDMLIDKVRREFKKEIYNEQAYTTKQ